MFGRVNCIRQSRVGCNGKNMYVSGSTHSLRTTIYPQLGHIHLQITFSLRIRTCGLADPTPKAINYFATEWVVPTSRGAVCLGSGTGGRGRAMGTKRTKRNSIDVWQFERCSAITSWCFGAHSKSPRLKRCSTQLFMKVFHPWHTHGGTGTTRPVKRKRSQCVGGIECYQIASGTRARSRAHELCRFWN
jgi:hypothetical protein